MPDRFLALRKLSLIVMQRTRMCIDIRHRCFYLYGIIDTCLLYFYNTKNLVMEVGSEDSPAVNDLITTLQTMEWMVTGFGVLCAAASLVFVFLGPVSGHSFLLFAGSCVFITLCINKVRDLAQVVERLDEKVKDKTD